MYAQEILNTKERTKELLNKYRMPYSLLSGCLDRVSIDGKEIAVRYLELLLSIDNIAASVKFEDAESMFEIGGGFGSSVHVLLENYPNIRKVLYLDIPPNLYVGTQYHKAFYGSQVVDYRDTRDLGPLTFSEDDSLEILCIAPWQIEKIQNGTDIFINSQSFVEMPLEVVKNYTDIIKGFPGASDVATILSTYAHVDLDTTFSPSKLPEFFDDREFKRFESASLLDPSKAEIFFISPGKLAHAPQG